jgi:hypothetical protein
MKTRRIAITACHRRRTVLLDGDSLRPPESTKHPINLDPTTNINSEKRRDDHECKDENSRYPHDRRVNVWSRPSRINLRAIRQRIAHRARQLVAGDTIDEQQLQDD